RASARFALWEAWNLPRPKTGWDWRTSSNRRCRDKSPCRVLRQKSKNGWRKLATKRRVPDPTETDRPSPSNPTGSRANKRVNLDRLHPNREAIERALAEKEKTLFNLDDTVYLYDLTSTYFVGQAKANPQAKRGYSRDKRPDCKQVVVGLVLDRDGFPNAHEIF